MWSEQPNITMWTCKHCSEENEEAFHFCWNCQHDPGTEPEKDTDASKSAISHNTTKSEVLPLRPLLGKMFTVNNGAMDTLPSRYKDAYTEAHAVVSVGGFIKGIAFFMFLVVMIGALCMAFHYGIASLFGGFILACMVSVPVYVLGILVAAQGQTQLAALDTAVNSSRHLSDDQVADILLNRFSL
jgi:hypothetical protein